MFWIYLLIDPFLWVLPWVLLTIAYFFILGKIGLRKRMAFIPFLAERELNKVLFTKMRTFYRPFVVSMILVLAALYLDPTVGMGGIFMMVAAIIYGVYTIRLYWRLAKAMGKGKVFRVLLILIPFLFLLILALGRSQYQPLPLRPRKVYTRKVEIARRTVLAVVSTVEILVIIAGVGLLTIRDTPPEILVNSMLKDTYKNTKDITGTGDVVTRQEAMGKAADTIKDMPRSRGHFYKANDKAKSVVVMTYIIGSNLEDKNGLASANITQMIDASKQGDGLTFVLETGGAGRWFTNGIEDYTVGRYAIAGGEVTQVKKLRDDLCMSEPKSLENFISWTKKNYPADRYMLVLWDHGGGVPYGYGQDDLNEREVSDDDLATMKVSEITTALDNAGVKFDVLGFDACLMQDIEIAAAMEPYADYYLASEETEGGYGWFYTSAFGKLAQDPSMSSAAFGRELIACYDPLNTIIKDEDGEPDTSATLSFVDLTLAAPAYDKLEGIMKKFREAIRKDPANYADIAGAASSAYSFSGDLQIDLVHFLKILDKMDYQEDICSHKEKRDTIRAVQSSILYRNGASAKGVYGMSFAFPYKTIDDYDATSKELKRLGLPAEKKLFDDVFSIIAAQQKKDQKKKEKALDDDPSLTAIMETMFYEDHTQESWYVKGFEDYDQTKALVDIPLKGTKDGYAIQLPDKAWNIISDCQTMVYQKTEKDKKGAVMRYMGSDHIGSDDANGHPLIAMDGTWVHIEGIPVCYVAQPVRETEEGDVFSGTVKARLNDHKDITLKIEWDPMTEDQEEPAEGRVIGYESESLLDQLLESKSESKLKAGDQIEFLFDYYDANGELVETKADGSVRVSKQGRLTVTDQPLTPCDIQFGGVLTDVYQRVMTTEMIDVHLDGN